MLYLIHYDRSSKALIHFCEFSEAERESASKAKLKLEMEMLGSTETHEIVLLQAASQEHLRTTHSRYFRTLQDMKDASSNAKPTNNP